MCSDCAGCGFKEHGITRSDCILYIGYRPKALSAIVFAV